MSPKLRSNAWLVPAGVALALLLATPSIAPPAGKEGTMPSRKKLGGMSAAELKRIEPRLMEAAARMPDKEMSDPMSGKARRAAPVAVSRGELEGTGFFHRGSGGVIIYRLADGALLLRLEKIKVTNGPALHVLLAKHPNPDSRAEVKEGYLDLGDLKGNKGSQNYAIPAGTDLSRYKSVVIYCKPFRVVFARASLK